MTTNRISRLGLKPAVVLTIALSTAGGMTLRAQQQPQPFPEPLLRSFDETRLRADLRFLTQELLGSRSLGTEQAELAARYVAAQFEGAGLAAPEGGYLQPFRILAFRSTPSVVLGVGRQTRVLEPRTDFLAWPGQPSPAITVDGELVFVGYGIQSSEWGWDDFKNEPLAGRILVFRLGDPGGEDPNVFGGPDATYQGTLSYKIDQAGRVGATGMLVIHDADSPLDWNQVLRIWGGETFQPDAARSSAPRFIGLVREEVLRRVAELADRDYGLMMRRSGQRSFRPVPLGIRASVDLRSEMRSEVVYNVVGLSRSGDTARGESIVVAARYTGPVSDTGDDHPPSPDARGSGAQTAALIELGRVWSAMQLDHARRLEFVATAGSFANPLGMEAFSKGSGRRGRRFLAAFGIDRMTLDGSTADVSVVGGDSAGPGLRAALEAAALAEGLEVRSEEDSADRGDFLRSVVFPLSRVGVPALSVGGGSSFRDRPPGWGEARERDYRESQWLGSGDRFTEEFSYEGLIEQLRTLARTIWAVSQIRTPS